MSRNFGYPLKLGSTNIDVGRRALLAAVGSAQVSPGLKPCFRLARSAVSAVAALAPAQAGKLGLDSDVNLRLVEPFGRDNGVRISGIGVRRGNSLPRRRSQRRAAGKHSSCRREPRARDAMRGFGPSRIVRSCAPHPRWASHTPGEDRWLFRERISRRVSSGVTSKIRTWLASLHFVKAGLTSSTSYRHRKVAASAQRCLELPRKCQEPVSKLQPLDLPAQHERALVLREAGFHARQGNRWLRQRGERARRPVCLVIRSLTTRDVRAWATKWTGRRSELASSA